MLNKRILFFINFIYLWNLINCDSICSVKAICNCKAKQDPNPTPTIGIGPLPDGDCQHSFSNKTIDIAELKNNYQLNCTYFGGSSDALFPANYDNKTSVKLILEYPCPTVENHYSTGSILLIIFFTCFFTYWALGIGVNYFLSGARGVEMIPNLNFWKDLPALILDGVKFIQNGCRSNGGTSRVGTEQEGYDAI